jgi:glycosyltransferase involved in cell wall biosynthesis
MKILHTVEFYSPSVGGMSEVVKQLSERLVKLGHQVTVATSRLPERSQRTLNGVKIEEFDISGNLARGRAGEVERYQCCLQNTTFDVISNFAAQQWATDAMITMLDRINACRVFIPTGFSGLYNPLYKDYFVAMKGWMKQYDANVFLSDNYRDINFAREHGVDNRILIPNGAGEDEFLGGTKVDIRWQLGIPQDHFLLLLVGSHTGIKGHAEAIRIFTKAEINNSTLLIVANDFGGGCARACSIKKIFFNAWPKRKVDRKRLLITSLSRQETVAAYHGADLFLFPSNIECSPLVLFESLASKTPFLSTDVGNAAEIVGWSNGGVILPTRIDRKRYSRAEIEPAAKILAQLAVDSDRRTSLVDNGFKVWQERFTWEKITKEYESLYDGLVKGKVCN